jgi:hypothetical protein
MKKLGLCVLAMTVIALMFSGSALAQGDASYYFTTYYSNNVSGAPDNTSMFSTTARSCRLAALV